MEWYHPSHIIENYDNIGEEVEITCILCGCEFLKTEIEYLNQEEIKGSNKKVKVFDCPRCRERINTGLTDIYEEEGI